jgi:hypothetical protein
MISVWTSGSLRNDELNQERSITLEARGEETGQLFQRLGARRFHSHAGGETDPVQPSPASLEMAE